MIVLIRNRGCDDTTTGLAEFKTKEELNNFIKIITDLNCNSSYGCMPTIDLYEISSENIIPVSDIDIKNIDENQIVYLNDKPYIFALEEYEGIYSLEKQDKNLIQRYFMEEMF